MSSNREAILAMVDAWNQDDLDGFLRLLDPEFALHTAGAFPDVDMLYLGHEGAADFWARLHEPWETLRVELGEVIEEDDRAVAEYWFRATGADSGLNVDMHVFNSARFRDGLFVEMWARFSPEEAWAALRGE